MSGDRARREDFRRRIYGDFATVWRDLKAIAGDWRHVVGLSLPGGLDAAARERIMLAISGVNRCRHCALGHGLLARRHGIRAAEISALLARDLRDCPEAEIPGLVFAIRWAESDGAADPDALAALEADYGAKRAAQIRCAARLICAGNRVGNTFDFILAALSGGRFGLLPDERAAPRS